MRGYDATMRRRLRILLNAATAMLLVLWFGFAVLRVTHVLIPFGPPLLPGAVPTSYRGWVSGKGVTLFPPGSIDSALGYEAWWLVILAMMTWTAGRWIGREYRDVGLCPACGYDLRATPDRCPECGKEPRPTRG
jgi:hypothetical protein